MNATDTQGHDFLEWLETQIKLRDVPKKGGAARKAVANIRRGARNNLHGSYDIARVAPYIGEYLSDRMTDADEWLSVIGALYATSYANVPQSSGVSMGRALRRLRDTEKGNDSLEARFMFLLNSSEESLPGHLRQMIGLMDAAQKNIGLDWRQLFDDVQRWDQRERPIQKKWLREFYRGEPKDDTQKSTDSATTEIEGDNNNEN